MSPLPDAPLASPAPAWFDERRRAVAARIGEPVVPSTDEEVWRYSRVADIDLASWTLPEEPEPAVPAAVVELLDSLPTSSATVVVRNGYVVFAEVAPAWSAKGVFAGRLVEGPDGEAALGVVAGDGPDVFAALNDATAPDPVLVSVPAGVVLDAPVVVVDWVDADGAAVQPRLVVRLGENAEATVLDWHGSTDVAALVTPVIELDVARAARLGYTNVQVRGPRVWQIASQLSRVDADATLTSAQACLGGDYARARTDCHLVGRGATGNLEAAYFGEGNQTLDFRTFQQHAAPDTTSNLLFKGAVGEHSRSVYTGLIKVEKQARGTNAFQTNRNLKLSEHAWAESVPNLEIETNDVRCSHASTVGPIDEDQRFYLESRGVPTAIAERLVVAGFFAEVLEDLPVAGVAPLVELAIEERLARSFAR
ncbi:MAG TPA: Fe-S cluster assembly protein SufD [Acidimicrobiales bacterium]